MRAPPPGLRGDSVLPTAEECSSRGEANSFSASGGPLLPASSRFNGHVCCGSSIHACAAVQKYSARVMEQTSAAPPHTLQALRAQQLLDTLVCQRKKALTYFCSKTRRLVGQDGRHSDRATCSSVYLLKSDVSDVRTPHE